MSRKSLFFLKSWLLSLCKENRKRGPITLLLSEGISSSYIGRIVRHPFPLLLLILTLLTFLIVSCQSLSSLSAEEEERLLFLLLSADVDVAEEALDEIVVSDEEKFAAPLIELYWAGRIGINDWSGDAETIAALESITGEQFGEDWAAWMTWYANTELAPPAGYLAWKAQLFNELSSEFGPFFSEPIAEELRIEEVVWGGVAKDGIPALNSLAQVPILEGGYFSGDAVFALSINGDHRAYPLRVMDWHEMANDVVGGVPVSIAYCTLCGSAIAYSTEQPDGTVYDFGSSGLLYRSNKLMYDRQTDTLWNQLTGRPVMGPLVGQVERLETLPILLTTVAEWAAQHPDATILPMETGVFRDYSSGAAYGAYFYEDELRFPAPLDDDRLAAKDQVFALQVDDVPKAYAIQSLVQEPVLNDRVGETNLVLVTNGREVNVHGYSYELEYITYSAGAEIRAYARGEVAFESVDFSDGLGRLTAADGTVWEIGEEAIIGPTGEQLPRVSGSLAFWFGWRNFYPETELFLLDDQDS